MSKQQLYDTITAKIVAAMENGVRPWARPWDAERSEVILPVRHNKMAYSGINILILWATALERQFVSNVWMTFRQALELGGCVRKGETSTMVVYTSKYTKTEKDEDTGDEMTGPTVSFIRSYNVFNVDQIDGLPAEYYGLSTPLGGNLADAAAFFAATGARVKHGGRRAFFLPLLDYIQMPDRESFTSDEAYAAIMSHELTHWTGHTSRLCRDFSGRMADPRYAFEELVAELGAAFLCAELGISCEPREDHAAYLAAWLEVLNEDKRAIFKAAAHAQRAVTYLKQLVSERLEESGTATELHGEPVETELAMA